MAIPRRIRGNIIEPNGAALEQFGVLSPVMIKSADHLGRGRPATTYHFDEEQALYVTMHCRTERAGAVLKGPVTRQARAFHRWLGALIVPAYRT